MCKCQRHQVIDRLICIGNGNHKLCEICAQNANCKSAVKARHFYLLTSTKATSSQSFDFHFDCVLTCLILSPVKAVKAENISKNLSLRQLLLKSPSSYWRQQRQRKRCKILLLDVHIDFFLLIALPIFLLTTTIGQVQHLISSGGLKMFSENLEHL